MVFWSPYALYAEKTGFVEGLKGRRFGVEDSREDYKQLAEFHYRNQKMLFSGEDVVVPRRFGQGQWFE